MGRPVRASGDVARRALRLLELHHDGGLDRAGIEAALVASGEDPRTRLEAGDVAEIAEVCEELRALFAQQSLDDWAAALNRMLGRWTVAPRLEHEGVGWHLHADPADGGSWAAWFASSTALAFAIRIAETGRRVGGLCAAPDCWRPFLDPGRGAARRFCSQQCATRARVAGHRSRHRE